jgi:streptomycin 6-kinase
VCRDISEATRLHIPNRYAESLLMPLARYYALSSRYFRKPELRESVIAQAADVLTLLGEFQPAQPEADREPKPRR